MVINNIIRWRCMALIDKLFDIYFYSEGEKTLNLIHTYIYNLDSHQYATTITPFVQYYDLFHIDILKILLFSFWSVLNCLAAHYWKNSMNNTFFIYLFSLTIKLYAFLLKKLEFKLFLHIYGVIALINIDFFFPNLWI